MKLLTVITCINESAEFFHHFHFWKELCIHDQLEIIIVTNFNVENYKSLKLSNLKIIRQSGSGLYSAMNDGISVANGKYLFFCGFNDKLRNIDNVFDLIKTEKNDVVLFDVIKVNKNGHESIIKSPLNSVFIHHQSILVSNSLLSKYNLKFNDKYKIHSDFELIIDIVRISRTLSQYNIVFCEFQVGGISSSGANAFQSMAEITKIIKTKKVKLSMSLINTYIRLIYYFIRHHSL